MLKTNAFASKFYRSIVISIVSLSIAASTALIYPPSVYADEESDSATVESTIDNEISYAEYMETHSDASISGQRIVLTGENAVADSNNSTKILKNYEEYDGLVIYTEEEGVVSWNITVSQAGFYNLLFEYYPAPGGGGTIERRLLIDDELPFSEANRLSFSRLWANSSEQIKYDTQGNQIMIEQTEVPAWTKQYAIDPSGMWRGPLLFYLSASLLSLSSCLNFPKIS